MDDAERKACDNPLCHLCVSKGTEYCCPACRWSHEAVKHGMAPFDPHHTDQCEDRHRG